MGSTDLKDYPEHIAKRPTVMDTHMGMNQSLIFAEGCSNISVCGEGIIDGRGTIDNFPGEETVCSTPGRPFLMRIIDCRNIHIKGICLKDAACWMQDYLNCENMLIEQIRVENQVNYNNDGIDIDGCRNVLVRDCYVSSGDDALCFKGASQKNTERILVENCEFYSSCNAVKFGTDTQGDFRDILIRDCRIGGVTKEMRRIKSIGADGSYGKVYIYKYDGEGNLVHPDTNELDKAAEGTLDLRTMSSQAFTHIQLQPGTGIDNMRILKLVPDEVRLSLSASTVFAGGTVQGTCAVYRDGVEIPAFPASGLEWAVYDSEDKYPADTELITVDANGLVTVDAMAEEQTVYIRVTSTESGVYQSLPLNIRGSDIFTVTGFGTNEEGNIIKELKVEKNFFYDGDVSFIVTVYDENGALVGMAVRNMRDNTLAVGENKISIDEIELPENFAEVKAMVWTSL